MAENLSVSSPISPSSTLMDKAYVEAFRDMGVDGSNLAILQNTEVGPLPYFGCNMKANYSLFSARTLTRTLTLYCNPYDDPYSFPNPNPI